MFGKLGFLLILLILCPISIFALAKTLDFDGDGKDEIALYDRTSGFAWTVRSSATGVNYKQFFGISEDIPAPGDYNGDGKAEYAVFRPSSGYWYNSTTPYPNLPAAFDSVQWGQSGDIPVPADYDGDGKTDRAVFRPSNGYWYILKSSGGFIFAQFGISTDKPLPGDLDNDGKDDIVVVRRENGYLYWYILQSSDGAFKPFQFGLASDYATILEFPSRFLITAIRPSDNQWYYSFYPQSGFGSIQYATQAPFCGAADYDNDGLPDLSFYNPSQQRYYVLPGNHQWSPYNIGIGTATDTILASIYIK